MKASSGKDDYKVAVHQLLTVIVDLESLDTHIVEVEDIFDLTYNDDRIDSILS